jgi:hypothetical protein
VVYAVATEGMTAVERTEAMRRLETYGEEALLRERHWLDADEWHRQQWMHSDVAEEGLAALLQMAGGDA